MDFLRYLFIILTLGLFSACVSKPPIIDTKIIGTWEGEDHREQLGRFIFNLDGTADVFLDDESFQKRIGSKGRLGFFIDQTKTPTTLDVIIITAHGDRLALFKAIVEFVSDQQIKIKMNRDGSRPKAFLRGDDKSAMVLRKQP